MGFIVDVAADKEEGEAVAGGGGEDAEVKISRFDCKSRRGMLKKRDTLSIR